MSGAWAAAGWALAAGGLVLAGWLGAALGRRAEGVARACHEVRGPLTAATLAVDAAGRAGDLPAPRVEALELELLRAGAALDDLSAAGRGVAGATRRDELVDLGRLLRCQADVWAAVASSRGSTLGLRDVPPGAVVRGDRVRLAQATGNLIANAIEHGGPTVELLARTAGDRVRVEVVDDGPGLSAPVAALARGRRRGRGARGRGLAIAADVAARHGGRVAAAPTPRGACVAIELPAVAGTTSAQPPAEGRAA